MRYPFTPQQLAQLESIIAEAKEKADQAARSGYESGSEQDGHHDEGYQLSLQQTAVLEMRIIYREKEPILSKQMNYSGCR